MRYKRDKERKNDVISLRLNEERIEVLERHRQALMEQQNRPISLSEAAFLVLEDRIELVERETARYELLKNPAESLWKIRQQWVAEHTLSVAEWDLLATYLQIGAEEQRQDQRGPAGRRLPDRVEADPGDGSAQPGDQGARGESRHGAARRLAGIGTGDEDDRLRRRQNPDDRTPPRFIEPQQTRHGPIQIACRHGRQAIKDAMMLILSEMV